MSGIWDINLWWEIALIVFIGIPVGVMFLIPAIVLLGMRFKLLPDFIKLFNEYEIDLSKKPYSEWMEKSPALAVSMGLIEVYLSWGLIKILMGGKWVFRNTVALLKWGAVKAFDVAKVLVKLTQGYMKSQWKTWDRENERGTN